MALEMLELAHIGSVVLPIWDMGQVFDIRRFRVEGLKGFAQAL